MWGIIPAAGVGRRIQPLGFAKELLPLGSRLESGTERPLAASEYLVDRMLLAGVDKLCFVISPSKGEILKYYGGRRGDAEICYVVQEQPAGLCDSIFRVAKLIDPQEPLLVGLPDTVWFPENTFCALNLRTLSFLRQMKALEPVHVTLTYCFTPAHRGIAPHYTSPPQRAEEFADFCAQMTHRYAL